MGPATPAQSPMSTADETIPNQWPGAFGLRKFSSNAIHYNLGVYVALIAISFAASILFGMIGGKSGSALYGIMQLLSFVVSFMLSTVTTVVELRSVDKRKLGLGQAFNEAQPYYVQYLLLMVILGVVTMASAAALVVPFFIIVPRLILAPYILISENVGAVDALRKSWAMTSGHVGKVWGMFGYGLLLGLLCVTLIGIPFAIYLGVMYSAAVAILYNWLRRQASATQGAVSPVAAGPTAPAAPAV